MVDKKFITKFIGYWIVNTILLALANSYYPGSFELGNAYLSTPAAAIFSGFLLTTLLALARGLSRSKYFSIKGRLMMFVYYWGAAGVAVWVVARIATVSGFGIVRFTWAIGLGFAISLSNWLLRQAYKGMKMV